MNTPKELKIRINDYQTIEEKLENLGAKFIEETFFIDTYFNQTKGSVLKIGENNNGFFIQQLKATNGKFDYLKNDKIENPDQVRAEFISKYGIKRTLKGKRRLFSLDDFKITLNLIDEVGDFLILTGENPTEDFIINKLGIQNPEYVRVSFDEL